MNLGEAAAQALRAEHQGHIVLTGNRLTDVAGVDDSIGTGSGVFRSLFGALSLKEDDFQVYAATLATRLAGQDGAVFTSDELQGAAGESLSRRLIEDNPAWHWKNRAIADGFARAASLVPEAATFFETFSENANSLIDGRLDAEIAVLQQTALEIGEVWVDTASWVITPIALVADGYDYSQGRVSTTDLALEFLPTRAIGKIGRAISTKVDDVPPLNARALNGERVGPWQSPNDISINTSRVNGALDAPVVRPIHKNSLDYVGDTHVYAIRGPRGEIHKIGESARGVRASDGASIRAEQQVRVLQRETGQQYSSDILQNFGTKVEARTRETRYLDTYAKVFGRLPPGNKTNR